MKTTLPFLLLLCLASCAHKSSQSFQTWKPGEGWKPKTVVTVSGATLLPETPEAVTNVPPPVVPEPPVVAVPTTNAYAGTIQSNAAPVSSRVLAPAVAPRIETPQVEGAVAPATTGTAPTRVIPPEDTIQAGVIKFRGAPLENVLQIYAEYANRTLLTPANINWQQQITLNNQTPLTRREVIDALNAVLALNGISMVNVGEKFVKVVPQADVHTTGATLDGREAYDMPELGQYATHIVQLRYVRPSTMLQALQPFAKVVGAVMAIDDSMILVLRDYSENVKRMLELIDKVDVAVQSDYVSEVIALKYAKAEEISDALNSLGGGGSTTPIGGQRGSNVRQSGPTTVRPGQSSSFSSASQLGGAQQQYGGTGQQYGGGASPFGGGGANQTVGGGMAGAGGSFQGRVQELLRRATTSGDLPIIGSMKMIADTRSNSLLIFASKADMEMIKSVIAKLDVVLAQVLIETIIMDVSMNNGLSAGVSSVLTANSVSDIQHHGAGGQNNGQPVFDLINALTSAATNALADGFPQSMGSGFTYWGLIGKSFNLAVTAAASDDRINVIQKPRILTSHAQRADLFVGSTVPYPTTSYGGSVYGAASTSFQQLQVGLGLSITPFINPDGLVDMQIDEEISELAGSTHIDNVGDIPNTTTRHFSAEVAVRDGDAVMLGGFIRNATEKKSAGVPLLKDIPILGPLFSNKQSTKDRKELIILMRPTVLKTPELAALTTSEERKRLPGVRSAEAEVREQERLELEQEKRWERAHTTTSPATGPKQ